MDEITSNSGRKVSEGFTLKDYFVLIRSNIVPVVLIFLAGLIVAVIYAVNSRDIFKAVTSLKITKPQGSVLQTSGLPEFQDFGSDRFIANEIEILKSYSVRERVAAALIDTFHNNQSRVDFFLVLNENNFDVASNTGLRSVSDIAKLLSSKVTIEQKRGLDILEITVESPSPSEAALIANCYAAVYRQLNLELNRNQLTIVKNFLKNQRDEKKNQLVEAEEVLKNYQEHGGIISIDEQASSLINSLSGYEADRNLLKIEITASDKNLQQYKEEIKKQDPKLATYLENLAGEAYMKSIQEQIAQLEVQRDMVLAGNKSLKDSEKVKEIDSKINNLKEKLEQKIDVVKAGIFSSSREEIKMLTQKLIEEEIKNQSLRAKAKEYDFIVRGYESQFNQLPKTKIEFARLQRQRESNEKLYLLVEEKYQEALINEQSQPGNVIIIDPARRPATPSKPNRFMMILVGAFLGFGLGMGYVFVKNYFDTTIKTPEDIEERNINVLAWLPQVEGMGVNGHKGIEFIVAHKPDSVFSEAFRALRTRVQFSRMDPNSLKTILVTSPTPQEGKTTVCLNLAGSFALANKRTLMIDCDLRKPKIHTIFGSEKFPGLTEHLYSQASLDEIIRPTNLNNLSYIASGTIPPNPAEMLDSRAMKEILAVLKNRYDIILIDSPPVITVTDAEILSRMVDGNILVVSSNTTEFELLEKSVELLKNDKAVLIGSVLNNFNYKNTYSSYYKYYYYYPRSTNGNKSKTSENIKS